MQRNVREMLTHLGWLGHELAHGVQPVAHVQRWYAQQCRSGNSKAMRAKRKGL